MSSRWKTLGLAALLVCPALFAQPAFLSAREVVLEGSSWPIEPARRETLLTYGGYVTSFENQFSAQSGMAIAVRFHAPAWATHVAAIEYYIMNDNVTNPENPTWPTTAPFEAVVWRPGTAQPGAAAVSGFAPFDWYGYQEGTLVRAVFPEPVDLSDPVAFPGKEFYAGLEWMFRNNPIIGYEVAVPIDAQSYWWNWSAWQHLTTYDVIINAVVWTEEVYVPRTITVDVDGGGDFTTIQEGLDSAGSRDTVLVAPGVYSGPLNRDLTFAGRNVALVSRGGRARTVIDCEHEGRGIFLRDGENETALIRGLTIRNGTGSGGAVRLVNAWPTIEDCFFEENEGSYGGAVYATNPVTASPRIRGCIFASNTAAAGGGAVRLDYSQPLIEGCTFYGNSAPAGGGIDCGTMSFPTVRNSIITGSVVGQGVHSPSSSTPIVTRCCVFANAGGDSLPGTHSENLFADPLLCDPSLGDFSLHADSPCLPAGNPWNEQIGPLEEGCESASVREATWGKIKAMYR
jgi:hypothetical protein